MSFNLHHLSPTTRFSMREGEKYVSRSAQRRAAKVGFVTIKKAADGGAKVVLAGDLQQLEERVEAGLDALSRCRALGLMPTHVGRARVAEIAAAARVWEAFEAQQREAKQAGQGELWRVK